MKQALLIAALLCGPALAPAQEKKEEPQGEKIARIFELKYDNWERIWGMLRVLVGDYNMTFTDGTLVVKAERSVMPAVEEIVRRMDVPQPLAKNVELTIYLLQASQQAGIDTRMPDDLQAVIKQLRSVFAFQSFRLLDVMLLRNRSGAHAQASGVLAFDKGIPQRYNVEVQPNVSQDEKGRLIRLNRLNVNTRVPISGPSDRPQGFEQASINSNLDIREGQKVVVGKTGIEGSDKALILVVSGKVVD